jgi:hypothetical protein
MLYVLFQNGRYFAKYLTATSYAARAVFRDRTHPLEAYNDDKLMPM